MTTTYYVDGSGVFKGGYAGAHGIDVSAWTAVASPPPCASCIWDAVGEVWTYTKDQLKAHLAAYRYEKEIGGLITQTHPMPTDDRAKGLVTGKYEKVIDENDDLLTFDLKTGAGWQNVDNATFKLMFLDIAQFVQDCFTAEKATEAKIDDDTLTTPAAVETEFDIQFGLL